MFSRTPEGAKTAGIKKIYRGLGEIRVIFVIYVHTHRDDELVKILNELFFL